MMMMMQRALPHSPKVTQEVLVNAERGPDKMGLLS